MGDLESAINANGMHSLYMRFSWNEVPPDPESHVYTIYDFALGIVVKTLTEMSADRILNALFSVGWFNNFVSPTIETEVWIAYLLEGVTPPIYNLTIQITAGGTTEPSPGIYTYDTGAVATITAKPEPNQYFQQWTLNGVTRKENPINMTMNQDYTLIATFAGVPPNGGGNGGGGGGGGGGASSQIIIPIAIVGVLSIVFLGYFILKKK